MISNPVIRVSKGQDILLSLCCLTKIFTSPAVPLCRDKITYQEKKKKKGKGRSKTRKGHSKTEKDVLKQEKML